MFIEFLCGSFYKLSALAMTLLLAIRAMHAKRVN
jgi:hypothetical protein